MKKLRLDLDSLAVETFHPQSDLPEGGTVHGHDDWTLTLSGCDTCAATCDAGDATCGASCGTACRATVNTPECWTASCPNQTYCNVTACRQWHLQQHAEFGKVDEPI